MRNYLKNIDEEAFFSWLRAKGWAEDSSPETESWPVPAWRHEGRMVTKREDWLVDDYEDYQYEKEQALRAQPAGEETP